MKLVYSAPLAPDTVNGRPTCADCTADPAEQPNCPRCHGTGQEP